MKNKYLVPLVLIGMMGMSSASFAADLIGLSVGNFRPLEAETAKYLTPATRTTLDAGKTDLSAEDRQYLSPEQLGVIRQQEIQQKIDERIKQAQNVEAENDKREADIERLRQSMLGLPEMRPLFEGGKKLSARLSQYDVFRIMERNDMAELLQEARTESADKAAGTFAAARLASNYKVYVDVGDLKKSSSDGEVGGVKFRDTTYRRDFIMKLQNVSDGSMVSQTFPIQKKESITDVGGSINEAIHDEMVDEAVEKIADAIYQNFMATIKFSFKVVPNNPNLDPSGIALSILNAVGEEMQSANDGGEVILRKGKYTLQCQDSSSYLFVDGKDKKGPVDFSSSRTDTESFQSAIQEVDFTFSDPEGNFPSVTLTPNGWEGEVVSVVSPGPTPVRKGNYKLSATLEGYKEIVDSPLQVTSMTKTKPIAMMKSAPAVAPAAQPVP